MQFVNHYARLPARMFTRVMPTPVAAPALVALNTALATGLGLDAAGLASADGVAVLAGNRLPPGAEPLAQAYAGHQFGNWVPRLGDGRAILLGEHRAPDGRLWDIQLKGAGPTPFSRMGDGRAALGPVLREYLVSEAMHALGVPTTRALAAVTTGEIVYRDAPLPGAILTRVAPSHLRVGTFEYFAARGDHAAMGQLIALAQARHFPDAGDALALLQATADAQARLVAQWLGLGFVHGVMNTDNCHIGGLTIDYGPCAFMDDFHPGRVFSSIDRQGRYAWANQPQIVAWNLARLASCLLPLIDPDADRAMAAARVVIDGFGARFNTAWHGVLRAKLGLRTALADDAELATALLDLMAEQGVDFTRTFRSLAEGTAAAEFPDPAPVVEWRSRWLARLRAEGQHPDDAMIAMQAANPALIPRNHRIAAAIAAAEGGDFAPFHQLAAAWAKPFAAAPDDPLRAAPTPAEVVHVTFCGT